MSTHNRVPIGQTRLLSLSPGGLSCCNHHSLSEKARWHYREFGFFAKTRERWELVESGGPFVGRQWRGFALSWRLESDTVRRGALVQYYLVSFWPRPAPLPNGHSF